MDTPGVLLVFRVRRQLRRAVLVRRPLFGRPAIGRGLYRPRVVLLAFGIASVQTASHLLRVSVSSLARTYLVDQISRGAQLVPVQTPAAPLMQIGRKTIGADILAQGIYERCRCLKGGQVFVGSGVDLGKNAAPELILGRVVS